MGNVTAEVPLSKEEVKGFHLLAVMGVLSGLEDPSQPRKGGCWWSHKPAAPFKMKYLNTENLMWEMY